MKFGVGSTTELTQKCEGQSTKMPYVHPNICDRLCKNQEFWQVSKLGNSKNTDCGQIS